MDNKQTTSIADIVAAVLSLPPGTVAHASYTTDEKGVQDFTLETISSKVGQA